MKRSQESVVINYTPLELIPKVPVTKLQREELDAWARSEVMRAIFIYLYTVDDGAFLLQGP